MPTARHTTPPNATLAALLVVVGARGVLRPFLLFHLRLALLLQGITTMTTTAKKMMYDDARMLHAQPCLFLCTMQCASCCSPHFLSAGWSLLVALVTIACSVVRGARRLNVLDPWGPGAGYDPGSRPPPSPLGGFLKQGSFGHRTN